MPSSPHPALLALAAALGLHSATCHAAAAAPGWDQHMPMRLSYFPGRDDCNPTYRPLSFGDLAFVVNCQWTMANVEGVLQNLKSTGRKAILSDSLILSRSEADMGVYRKYKDVFAMYYAHDEPLWQAVSGTSTTPGQINEHIDSPETEKRIQDMLTDVESRIKKYKSITADIDTEQSHVPVIITEAKPILNMYDRNYNVTGGNPNSTWTNFTLHTLQKFESWNEELFEKMGKDFDFYGFDWYDSANVTDNKAVLHDTLTALKTRLPNAEKHRYYLFPFVINDDWNATKPAVAPSQKAVASYKSLSLNNKSARNGGADGFRRDEFEMNSAYLDLVLESKRRKDCVYDIALLFVWTGTKEMSPAVSKTIEDCERYLNATPPASFSMLRNFGQLLDLQARGLAFDGDDASAGGNGGEGDGAAPVFV